MNLTIRDYFTGFAVVSWLDLGYNPMVQFPAVVGLGSGNVASISTSYFRIAPSPFFDPYFVGLCTWGEPVRSSWDGSYATHTDVMVTDLNTVNFEGEVDLIPFFVVSDIWLYYRIGGTFGRIPDCWIAPRGLADGDSVPLATTEYYNCWYWMFPGNTIPTLGP